MKTTASEADRLRRDIGERRNRRGPLVRDVRERGKAYARVRAASGATAAQIGIEIGLAERTIERWLGGAAGTTTKTARDTPRAELVPVRVVDAKEAKPPGAVVTTPSGLRIEGLDVDALCVVIARCG